MIARRLGEQVGRNPFGFLSRVLYKITLGRLKYAVGDDYDAERYWGDRFRRYGSSLRGPGHEGLSEAKNVEMYEEAADDFKAFCAEQGISFESKRVLEIGCGTGFYTDLITESGPPAAFTGLDVTDAMFETLRSRHPAFQFRRADVANPGLDLGRFDVIVMIDVVQHIVTAERFQAAMANVRRWLAPDGVFVVAPVAAKSRKELFYVRWWSEEDFRDTFDGFRLNEPHPFRDAQIMTIRPRSTQRVKTRG